MISFFFFNDTATTEIYTLSLHDALPIFSSASVRTSVFPARTRKVNANNSAALTGRSTPLIRSEERFSRNAETDLVCRLLLEKKKVRIIQSITTPSPLGNLHAIIHPLIPMSVV